MARKKTPAPEVETSQGEPPITLVGHPGALKGELYLQNPGESRMVFRKAALRGAIPEAMKAAGAAGAAGLPAAELMLMKKMPSVIVRPGEQRRVPLRFALSPNTPPGEYHASLEMEDRTLPVVFHVTELVDLEISPRQLVIPNQPGATETKQVVLSNRGNVPLAIDEFSAVPLDDELLQCRILRALAAAVGSQEESDLDSILTELAHQSRAALDASGILRVRNRSGRLTLQPGEVRRVDLEIRVPESLDKRTRYRALLPLYTSNLEILIAPAFDIHGS